MLFCWAAITKYHRPSGLNNSNVLSHSSRRWKSKNKVSAGLAPSGDCWGEHVTGPCPGSSCFLAVWCSLACRSIPSLHLHGHCCSPSAVSASQASLFIRAMVILDTDSILFPFEFPPLCVGSGIQEQLLDKYIKT